MFKCMSDVGNSVCVGFIANWYDDKDSGAGALITIGADRAGAVEFMMSPEEARKFAIAIVDMANKIDARKARSGS